MSVSGSLTFAAGTTQQIITVTVFGDSLFESNETLFIDLTVPYNATLTDAQGQGTIGNDD